MMAAATIYFIACHGGPAAHFAEFASELRREGFSVELLATGPAFDKLQSSGAIELNPDRLDLNSPASCRGLAQKIAETIRDASAIVTDVGHPFLAAVQEETAHSAPSVKRFAYYDNPESFVPGGYSQTAAKVMALADKVLFSNRHLAEAPLYQNPGVFFDLPLEKRVGLGYYPLAQAHFLKGARSARKEIARRLFFQQKGLEDTGQKILLYLGGNNEVFFEKAFPAFLHLLRESRLDPSRYLVVMQHHPGAKKREIDTKLSGGYPLLVSTVSSEEALLFADAALYYQTSMGPLLALAGIPAIQVGHETFPDILVRSKIAPSATTKQSFLSAVETAAAQEDSCKLLDDLGLCADWESRLLSALTGM